MLSPFRPLFIALAVALLGYGYYLVYFAPATTCPGGAACPTPGTKRWMKCVLWSATALALAGFGVEYLEPHLIG